MMRTCRLCGRERKLVDSHIIPRAFFQIEPDQPPRLFSNRREFHPRRAPKGVYDQIVCEACERRFSEYDNYAVKLLIRERVVREPIKHRGATIAYVVPDIDYKNLKLFVIAVLWRASVSDQVFYSKVRLGHLEDLTR